MLQACNAALSSENGHFFTWLFTKMAVSVVGGWESGQELAGSPFVLKNAWICLITSFSFVGNNPSLQIRSFRENRGKCNRTCDPTDRLFSSVPMRQDLNVADSSYLPWYEANEHSPSLSSLLLSMPCWEGEPNARQFFAEIFIKRRFCSKKLCLLCCILSVYRLQIMICNFFSPIFDFCIPVDFGLNVLFPQIFSVLHRNSIETSWFSLVIHESPLTEEKSMPSSLDTRISMLTPPVSPNFHAECICTPKKNL